MRPNLRMVFENRIETLNHLMEVTKAYLKPYPLSGKARFAVELILEEVVTNVIHHAFEAVPVTAQEPHLIAVDLEVSERGVHLGVTDDGRPFNPLSVPRLDVDQPLLERLEGGLGIHLVRQMMDSMAYRRKSGHNYFEIWIRDREGDGKPAEKTV
ncbi:MAG: ATP-binding protein [Desulfosarcinaceae bacterium]